jgi:hypothetical protein
MDRLVSALCRKCPLNEMEQMAANKGHEVDVPNQSFLRCSIDEIKLIDRTPRPGRKERWKFEFWRFLMSHGRDSIGLINGPLGRS